MLASAKKAREEAYAAANNMWAKTKVVRSKFPASSRNGQQHGRKASFVAWGPMGQPKTHFEADAEDVIYYDSMRDLWEEDIHNLPVAKDLPRLIRRVCIVNQEEEILFLPAGGRAPDRMRPAVKKESQESAEETDEGETTPPSDSDLSPEQTSEDESAKAKARRSSRLSRWSQLRKRKSSPKEEELSSNVAVVKLIVHFIDVLACNLETAEECERVKEAVGAIAATVSEASDLQLVVKELILALGKASRVARVLKTIHQNVVLHSTVELKTKLTMKYNTKDIRSADGWRIVITLAKGYIQVAHVRKEQSMDAFGNTKNHWEFEWEVRMTFDDRMDNMTAAQLRITRLILSDTMQEDLAEELKATLVDGLIVM